MTVTYEWDCETQSACQSVDHEEDEVIDHWHDEKYNPVKERINTTTPEPGFKLVAVLVRDDDDRRAWAYVEDGKLPEYFTDANGADYKSVPKRFHAEVAA